jgi:N-acylglucosamine 2-epimerase
VTDTDFARLRAFYEEHLFRHVMPFWTGHLVDRENGGLNNIVDDSGNVLSTDKVMWSQGRALWTFSAIHNKLDRSGPWLDIAGTIARFVLNICRKPGDARWIFRYDSNGRVTDGARSLYVAGFIAYGLTEYGRASGSEEALQIALDIYEETSRLVERHDNLPTYPLHIPKGLQAHGPFMIFALVYFELGLLSGREDILKRSLELAEIIMTQHVKPEDRVLYEFVRPGGMLDSSDAGRTIVPGHAIESMWFLLMIYEHFGFRERIRQAIDVIRWHLEFGWDEEHGGIFLARHLDGGTPAWPKHDSKVWWPATEALVALLRAYELGGEAWSLEWYRKVHDYAFSKYPNNTHGDWHQNLDRFGRPTSHIFKELQVKDPFHLPRALIYCIKTLEKLERRQSMTRS